MQREMELNDIMGIVDRDSIDNPIFVVITQSHIDKGRPSTAPNPEPHICPITTAIEELVDCYSVSVTQSCIRVFYKEKRQNGEFELFYKNTEELRSWITKFSFGKEVKPIRIWLDDETMEASIALANIPMEDS